MPKKLTLIDVARAVGVSKQTVSRVINNRSEVADETRQRVLQAIEDLGYQPSALAQTLATQKSHVIGLVVPDISQPFYAEIARGIGDAAYEAGYGVFLCDVARSPMREAQALERLRSHLVAGAIICTSCLDDQELTRVVNGDLPVVLVNRSLPSAQAVIWPDYDAGARLATEHLLEIGRRKIAFIGRGDQNQVNQAKLSGYRAGLEGAGIPFNPQRILRTSSVFQGGYQAMTTILEQGIEVDGIVAVNDLIAIGVMLCALANGVRVPDDLAVVGFGNSEASRMVTPALTTIAVPHHAIGVAAVQELLALDQGHRHNVRQVERAPQLLVRASTVGEAESVWRDDEHSLLPSFAEC